MPEPTTTTASVVTLTTMAAATPVLHVAGVSLGLRPDVLLAGFAGAVAAMALLNSVRGTGDTWRELLRTSARRVGVAVGSSITAGYMAPLLGLIDGIPAALQAAADRTAELARLAQQQDAQRAALQAAQAELDEERRVLEDRASQVSADRLVIAAQRDHIRKQKPELAVFGGGNV